MKLFALQQQQRKSFKIRRTTRTTSFRALASFARAFETAFKPHGASFWIVLHAVCCLISLLSGFRFSRLLLFLLLSPAPALRRTGIGTGTTTRNRPTGRVFIGRHDILIREWPYPNSTEVMRAHRLIEAVQIGQRLQFGIKSPKTIIAVTPTFVRTFQTLHLTALAHSLMTVAYDLVWIVVEAGGVSNGTASVLARSGLRTIHVGFDEQMPTSWADRHRLEARMRIRALRIVREKRLDGIVLFADDSNIHSMELFDEIQSVKWIGAFSMGILAHSEYSDLPSKKMKGKKRKEKLDNITMPLQGPVCDSSGKMSGWHSFSSSPDVGDSDTFIDDSATLLPRKMEWAGFVLNSTLVWKESKDKPDWVKDLDSLDENGDEMENPLALLKDASFVEPLGKCGRRVLLWWLRAEARADSVFPPGWIMDTPLKITVPAKSHSYVTARNTSDESTEFPTTKETAVIEVGKRSKKPKKLRSTHGSRMRKHR